jgi:glycosyltransferase involved in cell wall biosynthesis
MKQSVTLVLPAHNEAQSIARTLHEIDNSSFNDFVLTIFVSEDGSSDQTREVVTETAHKMKNWTIILSKPSPRLGYSQAILRAYHECKTELIAFMDADGQYYPSDLQILLNAVAPGRVAVGHRSPREDSWIRLLYSKAFGVAYRLHGGPRRKDPSSPVVVALLTDLYFLKNIDPKLKYGFWWEFQMRISKKPIEVLEVPVRHRPRYDGKTQVYGLKKIPKITWTHLIGLYRLKRELKRI